MRFILKGGTLVSPEGSREADLEMENGKITRIGKGLWHDDAMIIDVTGKLLFPGFIDTHTHFKLDAGDFFTADDFYTGTKAAIAGGTTTILDFATQNRGETLEGALESWHKEADGLCSCDYGFHMSISQWNPSVKDELRLMTKEGVTSYKLYMAYDNLKVDDGEILDILKAVNEEEGIVGVHCENGTLVGYLSEQLRKQGSLGPSAHPLSRPDEVEAEAVNRLLTIARLSGAPVNIVHLSSEKGYRVVKAARAQGQQVYVETCPQYLLLDESKYSLPGFEGAKYVLSPPLRGKDDIECLWNALSEGEIDTIGTDHCSFNMKLQKERGIEDFTRIPNGIPGVEHRPVLMYTLGVAKGRITNEQLCGLLSTNAAKLFGMYPGKGVLKEGSDGDVVVWDPAYKGCISAKSQLQNVDYTPYEGIEIQGRAQHVFLRGQLVVEEGKVISEKKGIYIHREKAAV
jgi:dihydropyrimidinase